MVVEAADKDGDIYVLPPEDGSLFRWPPLFFLFLIFFEQESVLDTWMQQTLADRATKCGGDKHATAAPGNGNVQQVRTGSFGSLLWDFCGVCSCGVFQGSSGREEINLQEVLQVNWNDEKQIEHAHSPLAVLDTSFKLLSAALASSNPVKMVPVFSLVCFSVTPFPSPTDDNCFV